MAKGGVHGEGACVAKGDMCGKRGACMAKGGYVWQRGHAWDTTRYGDTVNKWAVRILLEWILVSFDLSKELTTLISFKEVF